MLINKKQIEHENILCFSMGIDKLFLISDEIIMFATNKRKVVVYTVKGEYTINARLGDIEKKLFDLGFFRTHQSYIVNLKMIKKIECRFEGRYIVFNNVKKTAVLSKCKERQLIRMIKTI